MPRKPLTRRRAALAILMLGLCFGTLFLLWSLSRSRTFQVFGAIVPRVQTHKRLVALTFDDGPSPWATDEILAILTETQTSATFFLVGKDIEQHPEATERIVSAGHEIGNHTYSHTRMVLKSQEYIKSEIEKTDLLIREAGYTTSTLFRPPYGKKLFGLPWYLHKHNRTSITWDIEPETYPDVARSSQTIVRHVLSNTRPGSIILLHVMYDKERKSMQAVRPMIKGLRARGYHFVTVSELLAAQ